MQRFTHAVSLSLLALAASCGSSDDDSSSDTTGSLQGTVVNAPNPVSGVRVVLTGSGGTYETTTSANGTYDLSNIPTGSYSVDLYGDAVFDANGDPIRPKIDLHLPVVYVNEGVATIGGKPLFMPERADGTTIDAMGGLVGTIPAGTVISNANETVSLVFDDETEVTFRNADNTTISITEVAVEETPVALPTGFSADALFAIEPAGASFDIAPTIVFDNSLSLPSGTAGVQLMNVGFSTGTWDQYGTGTVSANGGTIVSDAGSGPMSTGWHGYFVQAYCVTDVAGKVIDGSSNGIEGVLVSTVGGATATTDANGDYTIEGVALPDANFNVTVNMIPPVGSGFSPNDSPQVVGACGGSTDMPDVTLAALTIDETAPTVASTTPANEATDVDDNSSIAIVFDEAMSPGSFGANSVYIATGGMTVAAAMDVTTAANQTTVTLVPNELLAVDTNYEIHVTTSVMDAAGNEMEEAFSATFTTAAATAGGSTSVDVTPDVPGALNPGDTQAFSAAVTDASGSAITGASVSWTSDDPSVLDIDATGFATAHSGGTATVTGTFGTATDTVVVTVTAPTVDSVTLSAGPATMAIGSSVSLTATAFNAAPIQVTGVTFNWTSSDPSVATVSANGTVRAIAAGGPVTITVTEPTSSETANYALTVIDPANVATVDVMAPATTIGSGTSVQFSAVAYDGSQNVVPGVQFNWTSSDATVATVNANGLVTGAGGTGTATISAEAANSGGTEGTADVMSFEQAPLAITLLGGPMGMTPVEGVQVIQHDADTGAYIDERETNSSGTANFGLANVERASLSIITEDIDPQGPNTLEVFTLVNIEAKPFTMTLGGAPTAATFDVSASVQTGTEYVQVAAGGYSETEDFGASGQTSPIVVSGVEATELQSNGMASFVAVGYDTNDVPQGAAFLLDQDPMTLDGSTQSMTIDANGITTIPFTSNIAASHDGTRIYRSGMQFRQDFQSAQPATSGFAFAAIPAGTQSMSFGFASLPVGANAPVSRHLSFASAPATIAVTVPDVDTTNPSFDSLTDTYSWTTSGTDAAGLDVGTLDLEFEVNLAGDGISYDFVEWDFVFEGTDNSVSLHDLGPGYGWLQVEEASTIVGVELTGLANYEGLDAVLDGMQPYAGNFDRFRAEEVENAYRVEQVTVPVTFSIGGSGAGTVTIDFGGGAQAVADGDIVMVPEYTMATVAANATNPAVVSAFTSTAGTPTGVGTATASVAFDAEEPVSIDIQFN